MGKISNVSELINLEKEAKARLAQTEAKTQVRIHLGTCGISSGAIAVMDEIGRRWRVASGEKMTAKPA